MSKRKFENNDQNPNKQSEVHLTYKQVEEILSSFQEKFDLEQSLIDSKKQKFLNKYIYKKDIYITFLEFALDSNNFDLLKHCCLELGSEVEAVDNFAFSIWHYAAANCNAKIVEYLCKNHFKDNIDLKGEWGRTALHMAYARGHINSAIKLLELGANFLEVDICGNNILHHAAAFYDSEKVEYLCEHHFINNLNLKNNFGKTALHLACTHGHLDSVKKLIELGADITAIDKEGKSILHDASLSGHVKIIEYLCKNHFQNSINIRSIFGKTALDIACTYGKLDAVKKLIELGADVRKYNENKCYILANATNSGNVQLVEYLHENYFKNDLVLKNEALRIASENGDLDMVKKLLKFGADPAAVDPRRGGIIEMSAFEGRLETLKYLLNNIEYLKKTVDDVFNNDPEGLSLKKCQLFYNHGADIFYKDSQGQTLLQKIWNKPGKDEIVKFLQEKMCVELLLNKFHPEKANYAGMLKNFIKQNPEKVAEIEQLKQNETYVILSRIFNHAGFSDKLANMLKLQNPENAVKNGDFNAKVKMKEVEQNQGLKSDFKRLFRDYVVEAPLDASIETSIIGRMINSFKMKHKYEPVAEFSQAQMLFAAPMKRQMTRLMAKKITENDSMSAEISKQMHASAKDVDLNLLIAAALFKPKQTLQEMTEGLPQRSI